ncbi:autophagy-related protein 2 homolog B-like isoform X2 [Halichondria panicea]|uniref:autophagy-related protein 2 homolog B-like isoform X2 n=1 Tax=Halichondria panicea TaxID=6063 RepID=UPI00312BAE03
MPWFFAIPEFLKKRACRYLLQHYLGQFLEEKIALDDLTVDLYNGTGTIHNVPLNVDAINDVLLEAGAPVRVLAGYLGRVTVSVPWAALLTDSCKVEIGDLSLTVAPDLHLGGGSEEEESGADSLFSMTSSMQLAEEVLRSGPSSDDEVGEGFEGMEALARAIELVLARVQIQLSDVSVQINYRTPDQTQEYFLRARVDSIDFYDELSKSESSVDSEGDSPAHPLPDFSVKVLQLSGLSLEVGSTSLDNIALDQSSDEFMSLPQCHGVPIAMAGGRLSVKVKIKQSENESGPKLEVDGYLSSLHVLLSPQQLAMLLEMASGLTSQGPSKRFEKMNPGLSRPIPRADMKTIESQLARHQLKEQKVMTQQQQREDLFHADPWTNALGSQPSRGLTESTLSSQDEFQSLDLNTSYAESNMTQSVGLDDSFISTDSRKSSASSRCDIHTRYGTIDTANIALHAGVGLQQLSGQPGKDQNVMKRLRTESRSENSPPGVSRERSGEMCRYSLVVGGVTLALLESQPVHIYPTDGMEGDVRGTSSVDNGGLDPGRYFQAVCGLLADGVNKMELDSHGEELAQVLPSDHLLLWLSTVKSCVVTSGLRVDFDLSVASAELLEYLYRNQTQLNTITKPVSISPIVQLMDDPTMSPPLPCLKLKLSSASPATSKKKSRAPSPDHVTSVEVQLATVHLYADVTLLDRLQPLIGALSHSTHSTTLKTSSLEKMKQSLYMTTSNFHTINLQRQAMFNQAVSSDPPTNSAHTVTVRAKATTLNLSLRFPIPDLKVVQKPPWYQPSLQPEILYVTMAEVGVASHPLHSEGHSILDFKFQSTKAYLSCDGSVEGRQLFLTISSPHPMTTPTHPPECGHIRLVIQPPTHSALDETGGRKGGRGVDILGRCDSLEGDVGSKVNEPSPFSSQKTMLSTSKTADKESSGRTEEQVLPGSRREMNHFQSHASDSAHYSVSCTLPQVKVHLPSNKFLEVLYNRFATDLALWEPASPEAVDRANAHSMLMSCMDVLQPAATSEDRFQMCKSVLKEEDSDDESTIDHAPSSIDHTHPPPAASSLTVSLSIQEATVSLLTAGDYDKSGVPSEACPEESMDSTIFHSAQSVVQLLDLSPRGTGHPPVSSPNNGLVLLQASGLHLFTVLGYKGDPSHDFVCIQIGQLSLRHSGSLDGDSYSCVEDPHNTHSLLATLHSVLHSSHTLHTSGYERPEPMVAIAMETKFDKERNSKTNKVSVAIRDTTLQYHMTSPQQNAFKQLGEFFTLTDDEVLGYEPPSIITELHTHLHSCCLEYKPLHLPLHLLLTLDSVSVSTSLVTGAPVMVVRLIADNTQILLSHEQVHQPDPKQGFVCVVEMEWFECTLRLCSNDLLGEEDQELFSRLPDLSLECSSNVIHLRTCVDSCIALRDLLVYMATHGDLQTPHSVVDQRDYSSLGHEHSSINSQGSSASGSSPLTSLTETTNIGDLISDAMEDSPPSHLHTSHSRPHTPHKSGRKKKPGKTSAISKMPVCVETDKSVVLDFFSDSSDEDVKSEGGGGGVRGRLLSPPHKLSASEHSSIFSESEDDFCFVDTPTSTRVSPGSRPQMKSLLERGERIDLVDNHFSLPDGHTNQLQRPKHFPEPVTQFTLREMTIVWHLYGGSDFSPPTPPTQRSRSGSGASPALGRKYSSSPGADFVKVPPVGGRDRKIAGGPGRRHDILVELELDKLRIQHERYPGDSEQAARLVVLVNEVEIRDLLRHSSINKLLYQYTTETTPRQCHAHMLSLKILYTRPELTSDPSLEEASVRVSVLPIRLNMDQDTVLFLCEYVKQVSSTTAVMTGISPSPPTPSAERRGSGDSTAESATPPPISEVFIKSFIFQPDLPIRIDYEAKGFKTEMGTLAGMRGVCRSLWVAM